MEMFSQFPYHVLQMMTKTGILKRMEVHYEYIWKEAELTSWRISCSLNASSMHCFFTLTRSTRPRSSPSSGPPPRPTASPASSSDLRLLPERGTAPEQQLSTFPQDGEGLLHGGGPRDRQADVSQKS